MAKQKLPTVERRAQLLQEAGIDLPERAGPLPPGALTDLIGLLGKHHIWGDPDLTLALFERLLEVVAESPRHRPLSVRILVLASPV